LLIAGVLGIKEQTIIYKTLKTKLKIEQHKPIKNWEWTRVLRTDKQFLLHKWHPSCCSCYKPGESHEWGKDWIMIMIMIMITTNGTHPWSLWHRYSVTV